VSDDLLQRLQRNAAIACGVMALAALILTREWRAVLGVIGGGVLIGVSFVSIRSAIDELAPDRGETGATPQRPDMGRALVRLVGRYALLAILAYVMIARLRMHPLGLVAGASSVGVAAALEAGRLFRNKSE
jgi:small-conductance mechanosensitive channel